MEELQAAADLDRYTRAGLRERDCHRALSQWNARAIPSGMQELALALEEIDKLRWGDR